MLHTQPTGKKIQPINQSIPAGDFRRLGEGKCCWPVGSSVTTVVHVHEDERSIIHGEIYAERAEKRREMSVGELMTNLFRFEAFWSWFYCSDSDNCSEFSRQVEWGQFWHCDHSMLDLVVVGDNIFFLVILLQILVATRICQITSRCHTGNIASQSGLQYLLFYKSCTSLF